jgi:drug/metabolite transporter (DMT)-like permease
MMLAALLALTASVAYGTSDFVASYAARRVTPLAIAWWAHVLGALVLAGLGLTVAGLPEVSALAFGALAGAIAAAGLVLFYGALARGPVSIVTPLAATGAAIPVLVGVARGEAPSVVGMFGLAVAAVGVLTVATTRTVAEEPDPPGPGARPGCPEEQGSRAPRLPPVVAALLAAASFGVAFVLVDAGGQDASPLWVAAGLQAGGVLGLVPIVLGGPLARLALTRPSLATVAGTGALVAGGDVALAFAFAEGALGTVSVLSSLDSIVSVLLAQMILMERLSARQTAGVGAAVTGAVLLAAG